MTTVALVSLARRQAMGEVRRVASWRQLFTAAGAEVVEVAAAPDGRPHLDGLFQVATGRTPPERLAWSGRQLRDALRAASPDVVLVVTTRAFDPKIATGPWTLVLDLVDSLARSYRDRADVVDGAYRRAFYRYLAASHARVEGRLHQGNVRRVAAGWADARHLGAEWVPNLVDDTLHARSSSAPDHDLLFFGTLRYPPNIDALQMLARCWPSILVHRPGTSLLVAGAAPTDNVIELCRTYSWELVPDFSSLAELAARCRIAVAPLTRVAGIQNKVLDAASLGLAQVVTPAALEGFRPGFPIKPCADDTAFVAAVGALLDDDEIRASQAATAAAYVDATYSAKAWLPWAEDLLGSN